MKNFIQLLLVCVIGVILSASSAEAGRTPSGSTVSASGSVAVGARQVIMIFSSDFVGTVLGQTVTGADTYIEFGPMPQGETIEAIAYTRSAGSIRIFVVR